jgi:YbgC/YbaW family acyl-CoA thioester hydrolase
MEPFRTSRRVEFCDTDMAGLAHFSNFFRWMESAEVEFLRGRGLSVKLEWEGTLLGFPRVAASCDFFKPAHFEDVLDVTVRLERLGQKSVTYAFEFRRNGDLLARGKLTSVCCRYGDHDQLVSVAIPESMRALLEGPA